MIYYDMIQGPQDWRPAAGPHPEEVPAQANEVPEQVRKVPAQVNEVPEQVRKVPEQVNEVPEQVNEVPEQVIEVPEQANETNIMVDLHPVSYSLLSMCIA